jgi:cell division protein FtsB
MSDQKPWDHPKYDVMNMANDDFVLASIAKLYKSEMLLAVAEVERLRAENARLKTEVEQYRLASIRIDVSELHAEFKRALLDEAIAENARLKAEVERLTADNEQLQNRCDFLEGKGHE